MNDAKIRSASTIFGLVGMVLARLVSPLLSFLIIVLVARIWGQAILGKYNTVWVWLVLFRCLASFGIGDFIAKQVGAARSKVSEYQTHGLLFGLLSSLIGAAAMIAGSLLFDYPDDIKHGIMIASLILPLHACTLVCQAVLTAFQKTKTISLTWILENFLFLGTGTVVIIGGHGFINLFWCLVLARLSATIFNLFIVNKYVEALRFQIDWTFLSKMLPPLVIFGVSSLAYQVFLRIDVVMLSKMTDMVTVGLYSSASNLMEVCILLPVIFYIINLPVAANGYKISGMQIHRKIEADAGQLFVLVFFVFGFGSFFADIIIAFLYGSSFMEAARILKILMIAFLIQSAESILAMSCLAAGYHKVVMYVVVSRAAINIVLNLLFIPVLGAMGAALTTVISISFSFVALQVFMTRNMISLRWIRIIGKPALACLAVILLLIPLAGRLNILILGSIFLCGYGLAIFGLNSFCPMRAKIILRG